MVDVLSFVDVELALLSTDTAPGTSSRQIAIDGQPLTEILGGTFSTLVVDTVSPTEQSEYLTSLLGGAAQSSRSGRVEIGYCEQCLDNDGWLLCASIEADESTVTWRRVGFDHENGFPLSYTGPWWNRSRVQPPADWQWWIEEDRDPELSFAFDRSQYEAAIAAELERIGSHR